MSCEDAGSQVSLSKHVRNKEWRETLYFLGMLSFDVCGASFTHTQQQTKKERKAVAGKSQMLTTAVHDPVPSREIVKVNTV